MKGEKTLLRWGGALFLFALLLAVGMEARGVVDEDQDKDVSARADILTIEDAAEFKDLELPPVTFLHDKHTEALKGKDKICATCHKENKDSGRLSLKFMRLENESAEQLKKTYHDGCIGCHDEYRASDVKTGPATGECRSCHAEEPTVVSNRQPMGFDKVLHFRHASAEEVKDLPAEPGKEPENCGRCHHEYDVKAKKLVPDSENEGTCRYCHESEPYLLEETEDVMVQTMRTASHTQCVDCHRDLRIEKAEETGPETCAGCHGIVGQEKIKKNDAEALQKLGGELPRLKRGQPDAALVAAFPAEAKVKPMDKGGPVAMPAVAFDHKAHEMNNDTCRVCHHEDMQSCVACHDIQGKKEGDFVQLSEAMHQTQSEMSCIGCHQKRQADPTCAGCHGQMAADVKVAQAECASCHQATLPEGVELRMLSKDQRTALAQKMIGERNTEAKLYPVDDIPEEVTVQSMVDEYKGAKFPHRRIVLYLAKEMKDDKLAGYFHSAEGTLCQGCHHQSPASKRPPRCVNCHGKPFEEERAGRPGLKAAYHGQCMGCHADMGIEGKAITKDKPVPANTDCKGCHEAKK